ncbi:MAG: M4 family metallopeptidase [Streptosporangiaceae bacterium]
MTWLNQNAVAILGTAAVALGGLITYIVRIRGNARAAARLIYAELTRDCLAVEYYGNTGVWPTSSLLHATWDEHGPELARKNSSATFEKVHFGYVGLEEIQLAASKPDFFDKKQRDEVFAQAVEDLRGGIETLGDIAGIPEKELKEAIGRLPRQPPAERSSTTSRLGGIPPRKTMGTIPPAMVTSGVRHGTPAEKEVMSELQQADRIACEVYDVHGQESFQHMTLARAVDDPPADDEAVDEAYDGLLTTWRFFADILGRRSIDGAGRPLRAVVHYGANYADAFWEGEYAVFGDGDRQLFRRFTSAPELVTRLLCHGVPEIARLSRHGQIGALQVSLTDVLGLLAVQYGKDETAADSSWLIGEGVFKEHVHAQAMRSLQAPGTAYDDPVLGQDRQPSHMNGYVKTPEDNGGIHINCGIPNHAFYLLAYKLGGHAWDPAGRIWWDALTEGPIPSNEPFAGFAARTVRIAQERYGAEAAAATESAWQAVGVDITSS